MSTTTARPPAGTLAALIDAHRRADREQATNETVIQMIDEDGFVEAEDSAAGFAEANAESPEVLEAIEKIVAGSASEAVGFFTLRAVRR